MPDDIVSECRQRADVACKRSLKLCQARLQPVALPLRTQRSVAQQLDLPTARSKLLLVDRPHLVHELAQLDRMLRCRPVECAFDGRGHNAARFSGDDAGELELARLVLPVLRRDRAGGLAWLREGPVQLDDERQAVIDYRHRACQFDRPGWWLG